MSDKSTFWWELDGEVIAVTDLYLCKFRAAALQLLTSITGESDSSTN